MGRNFSKSRVVVLGSMVLLVISASLQASDSSQNNTPNPTNPGTGIPPRYAVIDLGTNMVPMKITSGTAINGGSANPVFVLMNNGSGSYYRWSNGQLGDPLAPANAGDGFQSTDIDENGRVVGIESIYPLPGGFGNPNAINGNDLQLDVWAPGTTTAALTTAPRIGIEGQAPSSDYYTTGYWDGSWNNISQYVYTPINNGDGGAFPLVSPGSIWSSQRVYHDWGQYTYNDLFLYDGFQDQTELGAFRGVVQTPGGSTGDLGGAQVAALAVNDSNQALLETSTNFQTCTDGNPSDGNTWHPSTTTYTVAGHTVPFMPLLYNPLVSTPPNWSQGILSNVSSLGQSYVLGSDIAVSWSASANVGFGGPTYSTIHNYYCWDTTGTAYQTLPQPSGSLIAPAGVNAATATLPGQNGNPGTVVSAPQIIGNYAGYGYLWEVDPATGIFKAPQKLDDLLPQKSGWSGVSAASINDGGCIVGTANALDQNGNPILDANGQPVRHGVLLLPCEFSLLNGNQSGTDGLNFDGTRPTKISATSPDNTTTTLDIGDATKGNDGIDLLGIDPFGQGRPDGPGIAYVASLLVTAKVLPAATDLTPELRQIKSVVQSDC